VKQGLLPTPRATDGEKGGPNQRGSKGDLMLPSAVMLLPTPLSRDHKSGRCSEETLNKNSRPLSEAIEAKAESGRLCPQWVAWLMGFPSEWLD
jgi:hypothetical protein